MEADWKVTFDEFDRDRGMYEPDILLENNWKIRWACCRKHPGHTDFIPRQDFCIQHLPAHAQHPVFLDYFKCIADFTCYLAMSYISPKRPDRFPNAARRGQHLLSPMVGSGWVWPYHIKFHTDTPCPCIQCRNLTSPHNVWIEMRVYTAAHNVCDDEEAKYTRVDLFNDMEDARSVGRVFSLHGMRVSSCIVERDVCRMLCVTHDVKLYDKIRNMIDRWKDLREKAKRKYEEMKALGKWPGGNVCVIPSHPHGSYKHLTVGVVECAQLEKVGPLFESLLYKTRTCPGSSGAPVVFVGEVVRMKKMLHGLVPVTDGPGKLYRYLLPHSGATATTGVNESGVWLCYIYP